MFCGFFERWCPWGLTLRTINFHNGKLIKTFVAIVVVVVNVCTLYGWVIAAESVCTTAVLLLLSHCAAALYTLQNDALQPDLGDLNEVLDMHAERDAKITSTESRKNNRKLERLEEICRAYIIWKKILK